MSQKLQLSSALDKKRVELCRDTNCGQILNEWLIPPRKLEQIPPEGETGEEGTERERTLKSFKLESAVKDSETRLS